MDRGTMGRCRFHRGHEMKWLGRLMASAAALLAAGSVSAAVSETRSAADAAWTEAVKSDTLAAYAAFAMTFQTASTPQRPIASYPASNGPRWTMKRRQAVRCSDTAASQPARRAVPNYRCGARNTR